MTPPGRLRLYVTGRTRLTEQAIASLRVLCEAELVGQYELEIIDVLEDPAAADAARVIATPTVVRERPGPPRRLVGDLGDRAQVRTRLALARPGPAYVEDLAS